MSVERQNSQPTPATKVTRTASTGPCTSASATSAAATSTLPTANTRSALRCSRTRGITAAVATAPAPMAPNRRPRPPEPQPSTWLAYTGSSDIRPALATPNANERTRTPRRMCENMA